jgi:competence protein ComEC
VLISEKGLIGRLDAAGLRALDRARGDGFVASSWLENDGDRVDQETAALRTPADDPRLPPLVAARGRTGRATAEAECRPGVWIVSSLDLDLDGPCRVLDEPALRLTGAIALHLTEDGVIETHATRLQGDRPWTGHPSRFLPLGRPARPRGAQ